MEYHGPTWEIFLNMHIEGARLAIMHFLKIYSMSHRLIHAADALKSPHQVNLTYICSMHQTLI